MNTIKGEIDFLINDTLIGKTSNKIIKIGSKLSVRIDKIDDITGLIIIKIA